MAEKRLGSALTNLSGTANQLLRVKSDESGFEFFTPATLPSYTITNATTDRVLDASSTGLDELANVLGTLISDLAAIINGSGVAFQWSTSEQVWPFEKGPNGETVYAIYKTIAGSSLSAGDNNIAHGISSLDTTKILKLYGKVRENTTQKVLLLPRVSPAATYQIELTIDPTNYIISYNAGWGSNYTFTVYCFYYK